MIYQADSTQDGGFIAMAIPMTGQETDEQCKGMAWQMFCRAHPVEAFNHDPESFWQYFHSVAPHVSRADMEATLKADTQD